MSRGDLFGKVCHVYRCYHRIIGKGNSKDRQRTKGGKERTKGGRREEGRVVSFWQTLSLPSLLCHCVVPSIDMNGAQQGGRRDAS